MACFTVGMGAAVRVEVVCRLTLLPQEELYSRNSPEALPASLVLSLSRTYRVVTVSRRSYLVLRVMDPASFINFVSRDDIITLRFVSHCPPLSTLAPPLTVEIILTSLQGVAWRKLGEKLFRCVYNHESNQWDYPKLDEITQQHQSNDSCLRAVIECWLQGEGLDEEPSWRRIIWALDGATETSTAADPIRHYAEPLPGESCDSITFLYSV